MERSGQDIGEYVDAAAKLLSLRIEPAWREGVIGQLAILFTNFDLVSGFALPDEAEPATVFEVQRDGD